MNNSAAHTLAAFKALAKAKVLAKPQEKGDYADQSPVSIALQQVKQEVNAHEPKLDDDDDDDFKCPTCERGAKDVLIEEILGVLLDASPDQIREFLKDQKQNG